MIELETVDGVAVLRLNHGKVNALDLELCEAISHTFAGLTADAVVLTGSDRAFCAGVDLRRVVDGGATYIADFLPALTKAFLAVFDCPRPVVAAVGGPAIAGGCVLAAAADARLMSGGVIGLTELLVGVPFPVAALEIVRHAVGQHASWLVTTGVTLDPAAAVATGLIHEVVAPDELVERAVARARALAAVPAAAFALTKRQLHRPGRVTIEGARTGDDPKVTALWQDALPAIERYVDGLRSRQH